MRQLAEQLLQRIRRVRPRPSGDRGESLIEILMTVVIVSTAVVAVAGGMAAAVRTSALHRQRATAATAVRAYGEVLQSLVNRNPSGYAVGCAAPAAYALASVYTPPAGYTSSVVQVRFLSGLMPPHFLTGCTVDRGLQKVTIRVSSADGKVSEQLDVFLRRPCRELIELCS